MSNTSAHQSATGKMGAIAAMTQSSGKHAQLWSVAAVLLAIIVILTIIQPAFFSRGTWLAVTVAAVPILLTALGQTFVIGSGGIDLSVGSVTGLAGMVAGWTMLTMTQAGVGGGASVAMGALGAVLAGLAAGVVNGIVVTKMKVEPLIATLGMLGIAQGLAYLIGSGNAISGLPTDLSQIGFTNIFGWLPVPVLIVAVLAVFLGYLLTRTRFGRRTLAIGSNPQSAERAGINTKWHLIRVYALSGLLAGVAGYLLITRLSVAAPGAGIGVELNAITAAVLGGAALHGGKASILGTVLGALIIAVLTSGLVVAGVDPFWQQVAIGAILIIAVWADRKRSSLRNRSK